MSSILAHRISVEVLASLVYGSLRPTVECRERLEARKGLIHRQLEDDGRTPVSPLLWFPGPPRKRTQ